MKLINVQSPRLFVIALLLAALTGCATPAFEYTDVRTEIAPWQVVEQSLDNVDVIWGGIIVGVHHYRDVSEIEVLAYPLDRGQRPQPNAPSQGRFRIRVPGFVESVDFPEGLFLSTRGRLDGTREATIGQTRYVYPIVTSAKVKRWPPGYQFDQRQWSIGVGVWL